MYFLYFCDTYLMSWHNVDFVSLDYAHKSHQDVKCHVKDEITQDLLILMLQEHSRRKWLNSLKVICEKSNFQTVKLNFGIIGVKLN